MGKRRPGVSEDLMSNTAEEWKTMLAAPEVVSVKSQYESFSDVGESRVWFASKNLTPCRMH